MDYRATVTKFAETAAQKRAYLSKNPIGFLVLAMMAGAYVGLGILLIFSVGQGVDISLRPIVMGASFGLALTLVIFAGSELFTGHTMYMTHGLLTRRTTLNDLTICWVYSWIGNLAGAVLLGFLFVQSGGGLVLAGQQDNLIMEVAAKKISGSPHELFLKGILCNWLVCLAIWASSNSQNDMAKLAIIWFCLYAFIAAGFEHSVANMTVFSVALFSDYSENLNLAGALRNLFYVTVGNAVAGAVIMGLGYWVAAGKPTRDLMPTK